MNVCNLTCKIYLFIYITYMTYYNVQLGNYTKKCPNKHLCISWVWNLQWEQISINLNSLEQLSWNNHSSIPRQCVIFAVSAFDMTVLQVGLMRDLWQSKPTRLKSSTFTIHKLKSWNPKWFLESRFSQDRLSSPCEHPRFNSMHPCRDYAKSPK